jgi:hypothetical protein
MHWSWNSRHIHHVSDTISQHLVALLGHTVSCMRRSSSAEAITLRSKMAGVRIETASVSVTTSPAGTTPALAEVKERMDRSRYGSGGLQFL